MNYKIHTEPIVEVYRTDCACPLCALEKKLEANLVERYLGAAVMAPLHRVHINRNGFCLKHFGLLENGDNILGLALETKTRNEWIRDQLVRPTSIKNATKESIRLKQSHAHCVICDGIAHDMKRYYETLAALFGSELGFESILRSTHGHCMRHYQELLAVAKYAEKRASRYMDVLYNLQYATLQQLDDDLQCFIDKFDANKHSDARMQTCLDAVPRCTEIIANFNA